MVRLRRFPKLALLLALLFVVMAIPVALAATTFDWAKSIEVTNETGSAITNQQVIVGINNSTLITSGFLNAIGTDSDVVNSAGTSIPFMLAQTTTIFFDTSVADGGELFTQQLGTDTLQADFFILTGRGGSVTTSDAAALEPGSDFEIEIKGFIDVDAGAGDILLKTGAVQIENDAVGQLTATVTFAAGSETYTIASGDDDGDVSRQTAAYPPGTPTAVDTSMGTAISVRVFGAPNYSVGNILLKWDTSAIPDGATITSATLRSYIDSITDIDAQNWDGEWYTVGTIDASDYTATPASTAYSVDIGTLTAGQDNDVSLTSPDSNISKSGDTGLRLHISGGEPTVGNLVEIATLEHATETEARLIVNRGSWTETATVTGLTAGEHTLTLTYDGTTLTLDVDGSSDTASPEGGVIVDTANDWVWLNDNVVHYAEYVKLSVPSSTLLVHYQPVEVITGTTLPDEAGGDQDGTITFGANNANITATTSALAAVNLNEAADSTSEVIASTPVAPANLTGDGADVTGIPFFGIIDATASSTGIAGLRDFMMMFIAMAALVGVGLVSIMLTRALEITAIMVGVAFAFFWLIGVFPWWFMPGYGVMAGALILGRRMVYS